MKLPSPSILNSAEFRGRLAELDKKDQEGFAILRAARYLSQGWIEEEDDSKDFILRFFGLESAPIPPSSYRQEGSITLDLEPELLCRVSWTVQSEGRIPLSNADRFAIRKELARKFNLESPKELGPLERIQDVIRKALRVFDF